jgi:hypothetical protein
MGPFTHAAAVNAMIASHIMRVETSAKVLDSSDRQAA